MARLKKEKMGSVPLVKVSNDFLLPKKIYDENKPNPLGRHERTIRIADTAITFRLMPQGFWGNVAMVAPLWVSTELTSQAFYERIVNQNPSRHLGSQFPVHMISFEAALHFCNELSRQNDLPAPYNFSGGAWMVENTSGFRLLSQDEWSYAACAMQKMPAGEDLLEQAWCCDNSGGRIHESGKKRANPWGLFDVWGGLEEWVWAHDSSCSHRIGGSWYHDRYALGYKHLQSGAYSLSSDTIGFRLAIFGDFPSILLGG